MRDHLSFVPRSMTLKLDIAKVHDVEQRVKYKNPQQD